MKATKIIASKQARRLIAPLLAPSETPFRDYLKATDYCTAAMIYTDLRGDREYLAQWRAAFAALMVVSDERRADLLGQLRVQFKQGASPLPVLAALRE